MIILRDPRRRRRRLLHANVRVVRWCVYSTLHAAIVFDGENRVPWQLAGANACETRNRLALKSDFISNYILLDHYARHLCRYEISHPRINSAPQWHQQTRHTLTGTGSGDGGHGMA